LYEALVHMRSLNTSLIFAPLVIWHKPVHCWGRRVQS
jgi:hypothetical protein